MEKIAKLRTLNICLSDLPREKMFLSEKTGKIYINLQTWDYDQTDQYNNDFSITIPLSKEEIEAKKNGQKVPLTFVGNGKIIKSELYVRPLGNDDKLPFETKQTPKPTQQKEEQETQDEDDLPF